jgi:hypothetical protein
MTGTLSVRDRMPTPLYTKLVFEGVVERVEGRKDLHARNGEALGEIRL